jgi:hypothetical protein
VCGATQPEAQARWGQSQNTEGVHEQTEKENSQEQTQAEKSQNQVAGCLGERVILEARI